MVAVAESVKKAVEIVNVDVCGCCELLFPSKKSRVADGKSLVGTEGGKDSGRKLRGGQVSMRLQIVGGIVRGAQHGDIELL